MTKAEAKREIEALFERAREARMFGRRTEALRAEDQAFALKRRFGL